MSLNESGQFRATLGTVTGAVTNFGDHGDDFILSANGIQSMVDSEPMRSQSLGLAIGDPVRGRIDELEGNENEIDSAWIEPVSPAAVAPIAAAPVPSVPSAGAGAGVGTSSGAAGGVALGAWFDRDRYLQTHPDVAASGLDPAQHFMLYGAQEGRSPELFDEKYYLTANPDVAAVVAAGAIASGWEHFRRYGAAEGRVGSTSGTLDLSRAIAADLKPPIALAPAIDPLTGSLTAQTLAGTVFVLTDEEDFLLDTAQGRVEVETRWDDDRFGVLPVTPGERLSVTGRFDHDGSSRGNPEFEANQVIRADGTRVI